MADQTENVKVDFDLMGADEAADLAAALTQADAALEKLNQTFSAGLASQTEYVDQMSALEQFVSNIALSLLNAYSTISAGQQQTVAGTQATTQAINASATSAKQAADDIYEFADVYDVLDSNASKASSQIMVTSAQLVQSAQSVAESVRKEEQELRNLKQTAGQLAGSLTGVTNENKLLQQSTKIEQIRILNDALKQQTLEYQQAVVAARAKGMSDQQIAESTKLQAQAILSTNKQLQMMSVGMGNSRMAVQQLAFALQDATSVGMHMDRIIMALSNNVQMMTMYMGMTPKVMLGLTAGVAVLQIVASNWDKIKASIFGAGEAVSGTVEDMKKRLDELTKKPVKVGVDYMDIENLKKAIDEASDSLKELNRLRGIKTPEEEEVGKRVKASLEESAGPVGPKGEIKPIFGPDIAKRLLASISQPGEIEKLSANVRQKATDLETQNKRVNELRAAQLKYYKEGNMLFAGQVQDILTIEQAKLPELSKALKDARDVALKSEAPKRLDELIKDAQGYGPKQAASIKELERIARNAGNNQLLFLANQLRQANVQVVKEEELVKRAETGRERMKDLRFGDMQDFINTLIEDVLNTQLSESRMKRIGIDAREKYAGVDKQYMYVSEEIEKILKKHVEESGNIPEEMRSRVGEMLAKRAKQLTGRVVIGARAAEREEGAAKAETNQGFINDAEKRVQDAQKNIRAKIGEESLANIRRQFAMINLSGLTPGQKEQMREDLFETIRSDSRKVFIDAKMTLEEINDAMSQLFKTLSQDFRDQLNRNQEKIRTQREAQQREADVIGGMKPPRMTPAQIREAAMGQMVVGAPDVPGGMLGPGPGIPIANPDRNPAPIAPEGPAAAVPEGPVAAPGGARGAGGGFRSVPPQDPGAQIQGVVGQMQASMMGIAGQMANLTAQNQQLAAHGGRVQAAVSEHQISPLNFGGMTC